MSISDKILDSIQILADSYVKKAGYDRTIQAQIASCEDATIGKYRCRYQDATFYAYSNNTDVTYNNGSSVYILIPGNDMSRDKTILGSVDKLGINYISQAIGDQAYNIVGTNCITSTNTFYLNSNNKNYRYTIYDAETAGSVTLDTSAAQSYIKQSSSLIVGAKFQTSIPSERQSSRGSYGIIYNLRFNDNTLNQEVIRSYIINEDNMIDNPYRLLYPTRQYQIYDIDGQNFIRIESIEIFNSDFPGVTGNTTTGNLVTGDIKITGLEISGANRMTDEEINGVTISFYTPRGTLFVQNASSTDYKTITAQVKVKGKIASAAQNIPFYWGSEHMGISPQSEDYNKYLGRGWKCLNEKTVIAAATATTDPVIEWTPGKDTYKVKIDQATAKINKFKVAIIYDGNVISKQIIIENLKNNAPSLTIQSNGGTKFYYDIGHPDLTCKVNGVEQVNYSYSWAYEDNTGLLQQLPETTQENTAYSTAVANLRTLQNALDNNTKFPNAEKQNLENLQTAVDAFNKIQRVQGNKVYDVQINKITNFGTFKCSVFNDGIYYGTCSLTLVNSKQGEGSYSLVINNGAAAFQYNANGVAPTSKSLEEQQRISALTFTIYDNLGNPIDNSILNSSNSTIRWAFPIKDTMLVDGQNGQASGEDEYYRYYDNITNLMYQIAAVYDIRKLRNQIKLTVNYKNINLTTQTQFTFAKQGEPGTNGTEYIVKIIPNTLMNNPPQYPMIRYDYESESYIVNYGIGTDQDETPIEKNTAKSFFKAQLWHSGELIWEGITSSGGAQVTWGVLQNVYKHVGTTIHIADDSLFTPQANGQFSYAGIQTASYYNTKPFANIIKCSITWQGKIYYGTIPVTIATASAGYRVSLKNYTGWRYAVYTSDGVQPQYDTAHPFEFIIQQKINGVWEDISTITNSNYNIQYTVNAIGNYKEKASSGDNNFVTVDANLIEVLTSSAYRHDLNANQWRARPATRYDGLCVNAAITCIYSHNGTVVGRISVPIHFLLNKYGLDHINEWDGNSIQINEQGGFILSPQMGAGKKNNQNQFTGVLMGEVKTPTKTSSDIGLLGFDKGERTFFLNSENGSAIFGKQSNGQIIIDPRTIDNDSNHTYDKGRALLYSNNFWNSYNEDGLPSSYASTNEKHQGLLIDLTKPEIRFGNGNFIVNDDQLVVKVSGNIKSITNFYAESITNEPPQWDVQINENNQYKRTDLELKDKNNVLLEDYENQQLLADSIWQITAPIGDTKNYRWMRQLIIYTDGSSTLTEATPMQDYYGRANLILQTVMENGRSVGKMSGLADYIKFTAGQLEIISPQFSLDKEGNAKFAGQLQAASGTFDGAITASSLVLTGGAKINLSDIDDYESSIRGVVNLQYLNGLAITATDIRGTNISGKTITSSTIQGGTIKGGRIESQTGDDFWDLTTGDFRIGALQNTFLTNDSESITEMSSAITTFAQGVKVETNKITVGKQNSTIMGVFTNDSLQFQNTSKTPVAWISADPDEGLGVDLIQIGAKQNINQRWFIRTANNGNILNFVRRV